MTLHLGSFVAGYVMGVLTTVAARRMRPVLRDLMAAGIMAADHLRTAAAITRERLEDILEEARVKARGARGAAQAGPTTAGKEAAADGGGPEPRGF